MSASPTSIIVCPTRWEQAALRRSADVTAPVVCCGPGRAAVERWMATALPRGGGIMILAGVAGGLSSAARGGSAWVAAEVVDAHEGRRWRATSFPGHATCVVACTAHVVTQPLDKRALGRRFGADLVDLESAAFVRLAEEAGRRWAVVRGVSDDAETQLPEGIEHWTTADGRVRAIRIGRAVVGRPSLLGELARMRRTASQAMAQVAGIVAQLLVAEGVSPRSEV
jgi:nucleoside phosphorylase